MECPICDTVVLDVLVDDDRACGECGHRWTPDEALLDPVDRRGGTPPAHPGAPTVGAEPLAREHAA